MPPTHSPFPPGTRQGSRSPFPAPSPGHARRKASSDSLNRPRSPRDHRGRPRYQQCQACYQHPRPHGGTPEAQVTQTDMMSTPRPAREGHGGTVLALPRKVKYARAISLRRLFPLKPGGPEEGRVGRLLASRERKPGTRAGNASRRKRAGAEAASRVSCHPMRWALTVEKGCPVRCVRPLRPALEMDIRRARCSTVEPIKQGRS